MNVFKRNCIEINMWIFIWLGLDWDYFVSYEVHPRDDILGINYFLCSILMKMSLVP